jgi:predicted nuclease of predicted toxin-antitoxin system
VDLWIDAQLPPSLAAWMSDSFGVRALALRDLGLRDAKDKAIFLAARDASATVMTKDLDFVRLLEEHGAPPCVLWLTLGNTSNERLRAVLAKHWRRIQQALASGEALIEIADE